MFFRRDLTEIMVARIIGRSIFSSPEKGAPHLTIKQAYVANFDFIEFYRTTVLLNSSECLSVFLPLC